MDTGETGSPGSSSDTSSSWQRSTRTEIPIVKSYETLFSEFDTVPEAFVFLTSNLCQLLLNENFDDIRKSCIEQINSPNGVQLTLEHMVAIMKTTNLTLLLETLIMTPYWSWFDIRLIKTMAYASGNLYAINLVESYHKVVYSKKLKDVLLNDPSKKAYCNKLALFLNINPNEMTVAHLLEYRSQLEPVMRDLSEGVCILEHLDKLFTPEDQLKKDASKKNQTMIDFMIEARKQNKTIKVRYGRVLFSGSSGVGKTSFFKLLMNRNCSELHISTKLAQPEQVIAVIKVDIHSQDDCVNFYELNIENEIFKLKSLLTTMAHDQPSNNKKPENATIPTEQPDIKQMTNDEEVKLCGVEIQMAGEMSSDTKLITKTEKRDEMNIFTFMDTGGQPQFISMIPAVNSLAMVTFIVHDLQNDLNDTVTVAHGDGDGKQTFIPYTIGCTNLELIKSLISFSNNLFLQKKPFLEEICEKTENRRKENISYLSFIGSHLDKANIKIAQETDDILDTVIKDSGIEHVWMGIHSEYKYLIPVNNLTSEEENQYATHDSAKKIRKKFHDKISQQEVYNVPIVWLLLELEVRKKCGEKKQKFITYREIVELCHEHNLIQREDDIKNGLRFHHLFGVLLYFDEVPELRDYVFTDYQWVFDNLTKIVYQSYLNYGQDNIIVKTDFKCKGFFTESLLDKCDLKLKHNDESSGETEFDFKQGFIKLLKYLRIIAPRTLVDNSIVYFMPSLLSTCDLRSNPGTFLPGVLPHIACDKTEPLLVQFKLRNRHTDIPGSFPRGTFCCLIVELLQDELTWGLSWSDKKEMVFDNLVTLLHRPTSQHVTLIDRISYLEVIMLQNKNSINISIHYQFKQILKDRLYKIGGELNFYNFELAFSFICKECLAEGRHILLREASDFTLDCRFGHSTQKTSKHAVWDKEDFHSKSQQQTTLIETDGEPPCKKLKITEDTQMKILTTTTASTAPVIQPWDSQLHHATRQLQMTTSVTPSDEVTDPQIKLLDPDHPINCSATQRYLKNHYVELTRLHITDDFIISLYQKDVITLEEKINIGELKERKRMEYVLDHIIMPSLKSNYSPKYINFLNIMKSSDDGLVRNVASDLNSLLM